MRGLPLFTINKDFTANGSVIPSQDDIDIPLQNIPQHLSLQVTGISASGANVAASAWTVSLFGSNDGVAYDSTAVLSHASGTQTDGQIVDTGANFKPRRHLKLTLSGLTLGSAAKLRVTVVGV